MAELRKAERSELLDKLTGYPLPFNGHEGYAKVIRRLLVPLIRLQSCLNGSQAHFLLSGLHSTGNVQIQVSVHCF